MLESYLGKETFRVGVNAYIEQHQYANATAADFWDTQTRTSKSRLTRSCHLCESGGPFRLSM